MTDTATAAVAELEKRALAWMERARTAEAERGRLIQQEQDWRNTLKVRDEQIKAAEARAVAAEAALAEVQAYRKDIEQ